MRVPLSWLREFVAVDDEPGALADRLSMLGLAVEETIRTGAGIERVVVGRVVEMRDHPTSTKPLVLVKADVGDGEPLDIVCGARNFAAGDLVPVAVPGARLPGGFEITRRKLAGEVSNGMLCSARELGISDDHSGILVLGDEFDVGDDVVKALTLEDLIFGIEVTPNRPDCLSILGIAREVAAAYRLPLHDPDPVVPESSPEAASLATVAIRDAEGCPRYVARIATGLANGSSPWWMRRRLLACGMRPISAIVDVTNYVLLERGHPLHAFDLDRLAGPEIVVRSAVPGETLTTLDGVERRLEPEDVLICDAERPVAVAGIMGGADGEVSESTTSILVESAWFDPTRVLRTARRLGLRTEASVRFERRADPGAARRAADRACELFARLCGGSVAAGAIDEGRGPDSLAPVGLDAVRARLRIGIDAGSDNMAEALEQFGCSVVRHGDRLEVTPPTWRGDLREEEDLIEEVARDYGFDRVPVRLPPGGRAGGLTREQTLRRVARRALLGAGLSEAHTLSLIPPGFADRLALPAGHLWRSVIRVANPLSEDESVLRPSLIPGLVNALRHNVARRVTPVALFEIGTVFAPSDETLPDERLHAAWTLAGDAPAGWHAPPRPFDFYDAKGVAESLFEALGVSGWEARPSPPLAPFHPARSAEILVGSQTAGIVGELHPRAAEAFDLPERTAAGFVDLGVVLAAAEPARTLPLPSLPAVERDVALVVPEETTAAEVVAAIRDAGGEFLESVAPFDVYRGEQAGEGRRSIAFALRFRHPERTMTDAEADAAFAAIAAAAEARGWRLRV